MAAGVVLATMALGLGPAVAPLAGASLGAPPCVGAFAQNCFHQHPEANYFCVYYVNVGGLHVPVHPCFHFPP